MSILIKDMKMPKCCSDCLLNYDQMACTVTGTRWWSDTIALMDFDSDKERLYDCPLVEVKEPHGDLVDRGELLAEYDRQHKGPVGGARKIMETAQTVIEAEGREE